MLVFGLTGGLASGKSVVAEHFSRRGVAVVDADDLARQAVAKGSAVLLQIAERFGADLINADGQLERQRLAERVFGSPRLLELNELVHPEVRRLFGERVREAAARGEALLCYAVPLLFENQMQEQLRPVVLVAASRETQLARAMSREGWSEAHVSARLAAQLPLAEKRALADYVIENDGELADTFAQADHVLEAIKRKSAADPT
jgi:dephospho-CoA kinase